MPTDHPTPLWRNNATGETARAAALHIRPNAPKLRDRVLRHIEERPSTPEDIFERLCREGVVTVLTSVRPRCSELARLGLITDSGERDLAESRRCKAIVWRATTADERSLFTALQA